MKSGKFGGNMGEKETGQLPNEVDVLLLRIEEIKENCNHDWKIKLEPGEFEEIRSDKILLGRKTYRGSNYQGEEYTVFTTCKKCNSTFNWNPQKTCFICLGTLTTYGVTGFVRNVIDDEDLSGLICSFWGRYCYKCNIDIWFSHFRAKY